jgi:hypothetical protein
MILRVIKKKEIVFWRITETGFERMNNSSKQYPKVISWDSVVEAAEKHGSPYYKKYKYRVLTESEAMLEML